MPIVSLAELGEDVLAAVMRSLANPICPAAAIVLSSACRMIRDLPTIHDQLWQLRRDYSTVTALCSKIQITCRGLAVQLSSTPNSPLRMSALRERAMPWSNVNGFSQTLPRRDGLDVLTPYESLETQGMRLEWSKRRINELDCHALSALSRCGSLKRVQGLALGSNMLGDAGMIAWCQGIETGSLIALEDLWLSRNGLGGVGLAALAAAITLGALQRLKGLFLSGNAIEDYGAASLAEAMCTGGLPQLAQLRLDSNCIGDKGLESLATAVASGKALSKCEKLHIQRNRVQVRGMVALAEAGSTGGMPACKLINVSLNDLGSCGVNALAQAIRLGAWPHLQHLYVGPRANSSLEEACAARGIIGCRMQSV